MSSFARRKVARAVVLLAAFVCLAPRIASAQDTTAHVYHIAYKIFITQPASHLFDVEVKVDGLSGATYVDFQMPRWSPGRYAVFDFAKNVQEVSAAGHCPPRARCGTDEKAVERLDTQTWRVVTNESDTVTLSYKVFADDLSGTFSQLDSRHADFNGGSVFVYVVGHKQDAVSLKVGAPTSWKVINAYSNKPEQTDFQFPNYDILIDTPTEVAPDFTVNTFEVGGKTYRVVVHSFGDEGGRREEFVRAVERIVRAETGMMPAPDYEQYTFLFHFDPKARRGDGMEHLNSTQIIETGALSDREVFDSAVGTAAHEFFHVWNVKRLRPVGLGPWDFTRPVVTQGLWIAEGFTNYYGKLFERRAGIWDDERLFRSYAATIGGIESAPGSRQTSAVEASILAPFIDRATTDQRTNLSNTIVSYYPKGETLAVALDLLIRGRSHGRAALDDVMRRAYGEFYLKSASDSYYLRGRGYTVEDFRRVASEVAGFDLSDFFTRHVYGVEPPPYDEAFAYVGLRLVRRPQQERVDFGVTFETKDDGAHITAVKKGSPGDFIGLKPGDVVIASSASGTVEDLLEARRTGHTRGRVTLTVRRGVQTLSLDFPPPSDRERNAYSIEPDANATPEARALRDAWLKGR
jgi:predicted metalloprotease with PDZ domain